MIKILFIKGCVIQADKSDYHNDILQKSDIKKINLNLGDAKFDIQHNLETIDGCRIIENTITDTPIIMNGVSLNSGSWIMTIEVDNPYLEHLILDGEVQPNGVFLQIHGFSLFSYSDGAQTYNEVEDKSNVYPIYVSFVQNPANGVPFEILDPSEYISKSKSDNMAEDDKSILKKLEDFVASLKTSEPATPAAPETSDVSKAANPKTEEPVPATSDANQNPPAPAPPTKTNTPPTAPATNAPVTDNKTEDIKKACGGTTQDVSKACGTDPNSVQKAAPAGNAMETQGTPLTIEDLPTIADAICERIKAAKEAEDKEPEDGTEPAPEDKQYIVKQATKKADIVETPTTPTKPVFNMFGEKIRD